MSTHIEPATVLDAETVAELQPQCDIEWFRNHVVVPGRRCESTADVARTVKCVECGACITSLRCFPHIYPAPSFFCEVCNTHGVPLNIISIEPLR